MKYQDIKSLLPGEQQANLLAEIEKLQKLRFAHAISPIENPMRIKHSRRHIARLKTAQRAQETQKK